MTPKQLSIFERQILALQFRILAELNKEDEHLSNNYEKKSEILEYGYTGEYSEVFDVHIEEVSFEICGETNEILNMFRRIENTIDQLSDEEKENLDIEKLKFEGFDANNNPHYYYAKFMIEKMNKWQEHKNTPLNSHSEFPLMKYRKMLPFQELAFKENRYDLNIDDLKKMIEAI